MTDTPEEKKKETLEESLERVRKVSKRMGSESGLKHKITFTPRSSTNKSQKPKPD